MVGVAVFQFSSGTLLLWWFGVVCAGAAVGAEHRGRRSARSTHEVGTAEGGRAKKKKQYAKRRPQFAPHGCERLRAAAPGGRLVRLRVFPQGGRGWREKASKGEERAGEEGEAGFFFLGGFRSSLRCPRPRPPPPLQSGAPLSPPPPPPPAPPPRLSCLRIDGVKGLRGARDRDGTWDGRGVGKKKHTPSATSCLTRVVALPKSENSP